MEFLATGHGTDLEAQQSPQQSLCVSPVSPLSLRLEVLTVARKRWRGVEPMESVFLRKLTLD